MRCLALLGLISCLCAAVLCDGGEEVTAAVSESEAGDSGSEAAMAADAPGGGMQNQPMMMNGCAYVRCAQKFSCVLIPDTMGSGFRRPHCVRQDVDCDDLTDVDDDDFFGDEPGTGGGAGQNGKRQMGVAVAPSFCQNTFQCNQHLMMGGGMITGLAYRCCRVPGEFFSRRCVAQPSYRPSM